MRVDLHLHTNASDGQYTPAEVIAIAREHQLDVIAITDHDTTDGVARAQAAANGRPLVIPGIELSAQDEDSDVHMLGYFIDAAATRFQSTLRAFREQRLNRGQQIVDRLTQLGLAVDWEDVAAIADGAAIGRPHIARAMVKAGYVHSVKEAFDRYLYNGGPAYVARYRLAPEQAIHLIHEAGGAAVLAHPGLLRDYRRMVERLVPAGLDGLEVMHPENNETVRLNLRGLAQQHNLIITGGSDYHGASVSEGARPGSTNPPSECVEALRQRARRYQAGNSG
jgi:hypothetical protein